MKSDNNYSVGGARVNALYQRWQTFTWPEKLTVVLWLFVVLIMVIKCLTSPHRSTVSDEYLLGASRWLAGDSLYAGANGFLYLPQFAFLYSIFHLFPFVMSEIIWRLVQLAVLLSGLTAFARLLARPGEPSFLPLLSVVVVSMGMASFRNGQANIMLLGLLLLSVVALTRQQWTQAAFYMVLGLIAKPTFIVFFLLAGVLHRPLYWRLPLGLVLAFVVPALFKGPGYVMEQHLNFLDMLRQAIAFGEYGPKLTFSHFFAIFPQLTGWWVPAEIQQLTRLLLAPLTLACAYYAQRKYSPQTACYYSYALATSYLMLFNPRNETNDYILLSVAIGYWLVMARYRSHHLGYQLLCWFFVLGFVASKYVVKLTPGMWAWWKPVMAVLFSLFLLQRLFSQVRRQAH